MKKLEIIINASKLESLKEILQDCEARGVMVSNVMGYGAQNGYQQPYYGTEQTASLLSKTRVETVVSDSAAEKIIHRAVKELNTGNHGDGKIFVYEVQDAIRIRTGERGEEAL